MANSPLPLLIGAAAAFLILSKKGGGSSLPASVVVIEKGETIESMMAHFDPAAYDTMCGVSSSVPDFNAIASVGKAAAKYPRVFFVVAPNAEAVIQALKMITGLDVPLSAVPSGKVSAGSGKTFDDPGVGPIVFSNVTAANAESKILEAIDGVLAPASHGNARGFAQRGLAGSASSTANASVRGSRGSRGSRGLASSAPAQNQVQASWLSALMSAAAS